MTALFSLSMAVIMLCICLGLVFYARRTSERHAHRVLTMAVHKLESDLAKGKRPIDLNRVLIEEREDLRPENLTITVLDINNQVINGEKGGQVAFSRSDDWRTEHMHIGQYTVIVGLPWGRTEDELTYHAIALFVLWIVIVVLVAFGSWVLVGHTLSPIASLSTQADNASVDNLEVSLEAPSNDAEILGLVHTLNGLLNRLSETASAKGRFYSAASHELRTPLQALSGHLEVALSRDRTKEEYKETTEEAYVQTRRLISLVRALLFLYQLDSSTKLPDKEPVDLVDVCRRLLTHFQPIIAERGLQVTTNMPIEVEVLAPPDHIDMLVRNLIENATKYASANGHIRLAIEADACLIRLEMVNDCATPPNWKPEELYEPFSRPDPSRNSKTGGTGLGLAICKSIADANGWLLDIQSESESVIAVLMIQNQKQEL